MVAKLAGARIPVQIDIGFGDAVFPPAKLEKFPAMLAFEGAELRAYRRETAIAEKYHAMVSRGLLNSRLKDYFDILILARNFTFEAEILWKAISSAFEARGTSMGTETPIGLTPDFVDNAKVAQWRAFAAKNLSKEMASLELSEVVESIQAFLWPLQQRAMEDNLKGTWPPGGPWEFL